MRSLAVTEPHAGLVALLGAIVATTVFTIGLLSHRSHGALAHARDMLLDGTPQTTEHARNTVADAQSYVVLVFNGALGVLGLVAAVVAWAADDLGLEGGLTLGGFCLLELAVLVLGVHDQTRVQARCNEDLRKYGESTRCESQLALPSALDALRAEWRAGIPPTMRRTTGPRTTRRGATRRRPRRQ